MRKGQNSRRQRGRNGSHSSGQSSGPRPIGSGGRPSGQSSGGGQGGNYSSGGRQQKRPNLLGKQFESNGPEGRVRGTALQLYERYKTAGRETQAMDRVLSEIYGQFAEHYYRLAAEYGAFDLPEPEPQRREGVEGEDGEEGENPRPRSAGDNNQTEEDGSQPSYLGEDMSADTASAGNASNEGNVNRQPAVVRENVIRETVVAADRYTPANPQPPVRQAPVQQTPVQETPVQTVAPQPQQPRPQQFRPQPEPQRPQAPAQSAVLDAEEDGNADQPRRRGRPRKEDERREQINREPVHREPVHREPARRDDVPAGFTASSTPGFLSTPFKSRSEMKPPVQVEVVRRRRAAAPASPSSPVEGDVETVEPVVEQVIEAPAAQAEAPAPAQTVTPAPEDPVVEAETPAPRRRGRPRKNPLPDES